MKAVIRIGLSLLVVAAVTSPPVFAQSSDNVALVINEASPSSQRIGEHYLRARAIPSNNVIRLRASTEEAIERTAYLTTIEQPIAAALRRHQLQDRVLYIVLTKGVPLRIAGTDGVNGTVASVDSELTLLYRKMTGQNVLASGRVPNPYFLGGAPVPKETRFSHRAYDIYLVSRLDAFTVDEAIAMIDRAQKPSRDGKIVLDQRAALLSDGTGDRWLAEAAKRLTEAGEGQRVVLEDTTRGARDIEGVLGYYSWGSNDPSNRVRRYNMRFNPGALAATFVSSDGRTFQPPPDTWEATSNWDDRKTWFGGSPQSLIGDLIRDGATGVAGHVAEPYLQSTVRPEILFPAYLKGANLIEAFYLAIPHLSWQSVVVGDPLCHAFPRTALTPAEIEDPIDSATDLPGLFSKRRLEAARAVMKDAPPKALALTILAETRQGLGDTTGAKKALEEATAVAPSLVAPQLSLAMLYDQSGEHEAAMARYRVILKYQPNNAIVLNNLAYGIAVYQKAPADALVFAERASTLAPNMSAVLDTHGWIEHLLGRHDAAAKLLAQAVKIGPTAEIRLHAAIVYAAAGALTNARTELAEAIKLDAGLEKRAEVLELRKKLSGRK